MPGGQGLALLEEIFELGLVGGGEFLAEGVLEGGLWGGFGIVGLLGKLGVSEEKGVAGVGESLVVFLESGIFVLSQGVEKVSLDVLIGFGEGGFVEEIGGGGMLETAETFCSGSADFPVLVLKELREFFGEFPLGEETDSPCSSGEGFGIGGIEFG